MTDKPWLTDPKYGGMSERSARLSHEAWVRQGCRPLPVLPDPPASDEQIALLKRQIEIQLAEYEAAIVAAVKWHQGWKAKRYTGFRCVEQNKQQGASWPRSRKR